jgi:hypothetical protein
MTTRLPGPATLDPYGNSLPFRKIVRLAEMLDFRGEMACCRLKSAVVLALAHLVLGGMASFGAAFDHNYSSWAKVLQTHLQDGLVNYAALQKNTEPLDAFLREIAAVQESDFRTWSREQRIAFLINTYNAAVLRLVANHYPVSSIKRIGRWFSNPFSLRFAKLFGREVSLDDIEHGMLRPDYGEPRVHFALVCAARSCPILRAEPYVADRLNQQLDEQARAFLNDTTKNRIDLKSGTIYLSAIFKWFGQDFGSDESAILNFVTRYWPEPTQRAIAQHPFKIRYLDYDWKLNERK